MDVSVTLHLFLNHSFLQKLLPCGDYRSYLDTSFCRKYAVHSVRTPSRKYDLNKKQRILLNRLSI